MTILTKTTAKTFFEQADIPSGTDFANWIDSCVFLPANTTAGSFPFLVEVESTTNSTARRAGTVGIQLIDAITTASVASLLELVTANSFGASVLATDIQASTLSILGITNVGRQIAQASATSQARNALAIGSVGGQLLDAATTAAAINVVFQGKLPITALALTDQNVIDLELSGFSVYEIIFDKLAPVNSGFRAHSRLQRQGAANPDAGGTDYAWLVEEINASANTANVTGDPSDVTIPIVWGIQGDLPSTAQGFTGRMKIFGANNTALRTNTLFDGQYLGAVSATPSAYTPVAVRAYGSHNTAANTNLMRIFFFNVATTSTSLAVNIRLFGYN